jgi:hypothetical protein
MPGKLVFNKTVGLKDAWEEKVRKKVIYYEHKKKSINMLKKKASKI